MSHGMIVSDFAVASHRLLDLFRQKKPFTLAERQLIDSLLFILRMEWDYRKESMQESQAQPAAINIST